MYAIGLDIGIASVGYAVVLLDEEENPCRFIRLGVRIFDVAEESKTGASLALPRRQARSARRRTRRHRHRLERIKYLLVKSALIDEDRLKHLFDGKLSDIYALRVKALDYRVEDPELCRVLIHLAQRRGFKSNRKAALADKETGQLLTAVNENAFRMEKRGYRTVGEMLLKDERFAGCKRNKDGSYITTVGRDQIEDEARKILKAQQKFGNKKVTDELIENYIEMLTSQRRFDEGPGEPSPYAGNQIENMIGKCVFERDEPRAAKACYSFEYFNLISNINHLYLVRDNGREKIPLTEEQRKTIIALAHEKPKLNYSQIRKALALSDDTLFNKVDDIEREKKTKFEYLPAYHKMRQKLDKVSKGAIKSIPTEELDEIGRIIAVYKGDEKRKEEFKKLNIRKEYAEALLEVDHSKFCHLSLKALRKIIPFLEQGMTYSAACDKAGYDFHAHKGSEKFFLLPAYVPEMDDITSPVARRAISQTIKVVNAIIREQGKEPPVYINVELAREMAKSFDERKDIEKHNEENRTYTENIKEEIRKHFGSIKPWGLDIVKLKLWNEQDGISPYRQRHIEYDRLLEDGYVDIDHIIPYSKCFDDSYKNKVLVLSSENRDKGNRLPLEYLRSKYGDKTAEKFIVWVKNNVRDRRKRTNLLKEEISEEELASFKERNLQDSKTISRFTLNFIKDYLVFAPSERRKNHVTAVNGVMTSYLRRRWNLNKTRENGDKHHALDAAVVACTTQFMITKLSNYAKSCENWLLDGTRDGGKKFRIPFPQPWRYFKDELEALLAENPAEAMRAKKIPSYAGYDITDLKPIFVSRMPNHKVTGEAHEATIRSQKPGDDGFYVTKVPLTKLKLTKDGEIENYYDPDADRPLYDALKNQLIKFNGKAKDAFADSFYRPGKPGTQGRLVKKVKIREKATLIVPVHRSREISVAGERLPAAVASNGAMVRVDVFYVEGEGYYLVPIYVADTIKPVLPNKAIVAHKDAGEWAVMKDENFLFSLYPNDLIKVKHKSLLTFSRSNKDSTLPSSFETKEAFVYYKKTSISSAGISVITHDNSYIIGNLGVKTLMKLEKYQVDVLGNISKVKKEVRQKFRQGKKAYGISKSND